MALEYIFDPQDVSRSLQAHSYLRERLGDPKNEGVKSVHFQARKTRREIYRVLSNQHYEDLVDLLGSVEYCLKGGFESPKLLKTNVRQDFASCVSELLLAKYFLQQRLSIRSLESGKRNTVVPDLLVESAVPVSVEVYTPRDWVGMNDFVEDLRIGILHLDLPWDFRFEISIELISRLDDDGKPQWFNPWDFSDATATPKQRFRKIAPFLDEIEARLTKYKQGFSIRRLDHEHNVSVELRFENIQKSEGNLPARSGGFLVPTLTGHAPEGMFDQLVEKRLAKKIRRAQAQSIKTEGLSGLFVDVGRLGYPDEFSHPWYLNRFSQSLEKHLEHGDSVIDMIVFYLPRLDKKTDTRFPLVFLKPGIDRDVLDVLRIGPRTRREKG